MITNNQLSTQLLELKNSNLFDLLTTTNTAQNIDNMAMLEVFLKMAKEVLEEAKSYNAKQEIGGVVEGENYKLITTQRNNNRIHYNPRKLANKIKQVDMELIPKYLELVKIPKGKTEDFLKQNNLYLKDFADCLEVEQKEPTLNYQIKLKTL
jgi:hypothetical protein